MNTTFQKLNEQEKIDVEGGRFVITFIDMNSIKCCEVIENCTDRYQSAEIVIC